MTSDLPPSTRNTLDLVDKVIDIAKNIDLRSLNSYFTPPTSKFPECYMGYHSKHDNEVLYELLLTAWCSNSQEPENSKRSAITTGLLDPDLSVSSKLSSLLLAILPQPTNWYDFTNNQSSSDESAKHKEDMATRLAKQFTEATIPLFLNLSVDDPRYREHLRNVGEQLLQIVQPFFQAVNALQRHFKVEGKSGLEYKWEVPCIGAGADWGLMEPTGEGRLSSIRREPGLKIKYWTAPIFSLRSNRNKWVVMRKATVEPNFEFRALPTSNIKIVERTGVQRAEEDQEKEMLDAQLIA